MVFSGLKERLSKTHNALFGGVESAFGGTSREESLELIEEALLAADIGVETTLELVDGLTSLKKFNEENVRGYLKDSIFEILKGAEASLTIPDDIKPYVIMVLGVNGVGKTTTIG
ncbi:MAG: signal recognition particle receptor subunit alpha, partial [Deltaproteobacteria bacterium]|nr:signal recognition particle receptor subunit alpha [Deltaproteobacteria bacterium]